MGNVLGDLTGGRVGGSSNAAQLLGAGAKAVQALSLSDQDARDIGEAVSLAIIEDSGVVSNDTLQAYVTKVGLTLAAVSSKPEIQYTFGVLDTDEINAYSAPGGFVFITRGAIARMRDEAELAGVLAHEVAHVAREHGLKAVKGAGLVDAGSKALTASSGEVAAFSPMVDFLTTNFKKAWSPGDESDADAEAVKYLKLAGYDPSGLARFLEREGVGAAASARGMSMPTHPPTAQRVAKLKSLAGNASGATLTERFEKNTR
jgi:predicted Zn-dependent protease